MAIRVSSQPTCFNQLRCLRTRFHHESPLNHIVSIRIINPFELDQKPRKISSVSHSTNVARCNLSISSVFKLKNRNIKCLSSPASRGYSSFQQVGENTLPWLPSSSLPKLAKGLEKVSATKKPTRSSWEESAEMLQKFSDSDQKEYPKRLAKVEVPAKFSSSEVKEDNRIRASRVITRKSPFTQSVGQMRGEEDGVVDNPRWVKIKSRFNNGVTDSKFGSERSPEVRRWSKQENWGRKTLKEATESSVPRIVGEGVYGVGPVLAALTAGRREFYTLYVQQAMDLSSNNRKKKDKKGFEKVLQIAEDNGISLREISKHDLNMVVDNRPHQGLVLDASPLELVQIKELEPVSPEDRGILWVALDEVTDPQNLGAIIRSSYFFGASGVVLCAKNSAPLSGVVSKASAGSLELMELRYCKNMMQFLTSSADNGWRVLGGSISSKSAPLNEISPGEPTILVLGSEGTGLRPLVERSCTQLVRISGNISVDVPSTELDDSETEEKSSGTGISCKEFRSFMAVESLNVSVAAGVLLHHLIGSKESSNSGGDIKPTTTTE